MITIGYNQVQEKHVADTNSNLREDAHEAKKVYVGNKLAHVHVNDNTEFALRQTLNGYIHEDNDLYAKVRSIRGNTKVWNQLVTSLKFIPSGSVTLTTIGNNAFSAVGEASATNKNVGITVSFPNDHVYYIGCYCKSNHSFNIQDMVDGVSIQQSSTFVKYANVAKRRTAGYSVLYFYLYKATDSDWTLEVNNLNVVDLTLIYGAGNEPTNVAQFEADFQKWFGRPIGAEPYDAGSLIPFMGTGIKSTGFNQWDEETRNGYYDNNGNFVTNSAFLCGKNPIKVFANTNYYIKAPVSCKIYAFDANDKFIGVIIYNNNLTFTTPTGTCFIRFHLLNTYGTTYNNDICINLSNPTLNGTYVPYKATTVSIPVTTLTGKAEGSTTSEVIFPDGMKSAGSVKDEVYIENGKTYAVKRVGSRDLGTLNWGYTNAEGHLRFYANINDIKPVQDQSVTGNLVCSKYVTTSLQIVYSNATDKTIAVHNNLAQIWIYDSSYTDATTFKAAMSGVMLYYELATPIVYEVDNYTLPLYYPANGTGTEELLSTATTAPADMDIEYRLRQRVRLVDMGTPGVLWADSDIDITKPDGFCDSPFTYDKSFFSWGNVVGHNPISNTAFDYDWGSVNQAEPWYEGQVYGSTPGSTLTGNIPADAQYDAAKAILGGNWRMPSIAEYGALFSICKFLEADGSDMDTSKTDKRVDMPDGNGGTVKGIYIESTVTGNRLFFSCSGYGLGRSWYYRGSYGYYWSSTWYSARTARNLLFYSGGVNPQGDNNRCDGFALRPVYPISQ